MWDTLQHPPEGCSIDFLRGELSSRWTKETISEFEDRIKNTPNTSLIELKDAGHWMVSSLSAIHFSKIFLTLFLARR